MTPLLSIFAYTPADLQNMGMPALTVGRSVLAEPSDWTADSLSALDCESAGTLAPSTPLSIPHPETTTAQDEQQSEGLQKVYGSPRKVSEGHGRLHAHQPSKERNPMNEEPVRLHDEALDPGNGDHPARPVACLAQQLDPPPAIKLPSTRPFASLTSQNMSLTSAPITALQPAPKRTRNGKIARLPKDLREMVNRLLRNNIPYSRIVRALAGYEIVVTERNISNWKICGGYREWCLAEEHALELRLHQDNLVNLLRKDGASQIPEVGLQVAATRLSEFFLTPDAAQLLASNPDEYHRRAAALARLTAEIHKLQKYRDDSARALGPKHNPDMIRRDNEQEIEQATKYYSSTVPKDIKLPTIPHRNYLPKS